MRVQKKSMAPTRDPGWVFSVIPQFTDRKYIRKSQHHVMMLFCLCIKNQPLYIILTSQKHRTRCSAQISKIHLDKVNFLCYNDLNAVATVTA